LCAGGNFNSLPISWHVNGDLAEFVEQDLLH